MIRNGALYFHTHTYICSSCISAKVPCLYAYISWRIHTNVSAKEPYTSAKEPLHIRNSALYSHTHPHICVCKRVVGAPAKEPYTSTKESLLIRNSALNFHTHPHICICKRVFWAPAKEPYTSAKEPLLIHNSALKFHTHPHICIRKRVLCAPAKELLHICKGAWYICTHIITHSHTWIRKRALHIRKRATNYPQ